MGLIRRQLHTLLSLELFPQLPELALSSRASHYLCPQHYVLVKARLPLAYFRISLECLYLIGGI